MVWNHDLSRRRLAWQSPLGVGKGSTANKQPNFFYGAILSRIGSKYT